MLGRYNRQMTVESKMEFSQAGKEYQFSKCLQIIVEQIRLCNIPVAFVGGIPLEAYLGNEVTGFRKNGSVRDADAIAYCKNESDIQKIRVLNKKLRALRVLNPFCPEVGIEPLFIGVPQDSKPKFTRFLSETYVDLSNRRPRFYLHFGEVTQQIPAELMEIVSMKFGDVEIPTLKRNALCLRYFIRGVSGMLKPKDVSKVKALCEILTNEEAERDYVEFEKYILHVREKYPERSALFSLYWNTVGEFFSSLSIANDLKEKMFQN